MPWSDIGNKKPLEEWLTQHVAPLPGPVRLIEVGPGWGDIGKLVRRLCPTAVVRAIEAFGPYVAAYGLEEIYHGGVLVAEVQDVPDNEWADCDLTLWIDGPEHLPLEAALAQVRRLRRLSRLGLLTGTPIGEAPQGPWGKAHGFAEDNTYECHLSTWTLEMWADLGAETLYFGRRIGAFYLPPLVDGPGA